LITKLIYANYYQFQFDDAFISFRVAEVFYDVGRPSFFKEIGTFTSTSILYPIWNNLLIYLFDLTWIGKVAFVNLILQAIVYVRIAWLLFGVSNNSISWFAACFTISALSFSPTQWVVANTGLETTLFQLVLAFCILPGGFSWVGWFSIFIRPDGLLCGISKASTDWLENKKPSTVIWHLFWAFAAFVMWVCLTYYWYGNIIPQSILAKSNHEIDRVIQIIKGIEYLFLQDYGAMTILVGSGWYMFPETRKVFFPMLFWCFLYVFVFSVFGSWWAWYVPPMLVPMHFMAGYSMIKWIDYLLSWRPIWVSFPAGLIIASLVVNSTMAYRQLSKDGTSNVIRINSSKQIAAWLTSNTKKDETVLIEPLGMIAYFAQDVRFLDYPGLSNNEMSQFLRDLPWKIPKQLTDTKTNDAVINRFKPDWVVIFPYELTAMNQVVNFDQNYTLVNTMDYYPFHERFKQAFIYKKTKSF
jgi:hypothetical protein